MFLKRSHLEPNRKGFSVALLASILMSVLVHICQIPGIHSLLSVSLVNPIIGTVLCYHFIELVHTPLLFIFTYSFSFRNMFLEMLC